MSIAEYDTSREIAFFGSKDTMTTFQVNAEQELLKIVSSRMAVHDFTKMTIELQAIMPKVLVDEKYCFSGYHHDVMLLSALSSRLQRAPREHLFVNLQGEKGLQHFKSFKTGADIVSDTLFRIDAVQNDFSDRHSLKIFSRLNKLFEVVLRYMPAFEDIAPLIEAAIRLPKGIVFEGCHLGRQSKKLASFESKSVFLDENSRQRFSQVEDGTLIRWFEGETKEQKKVNYYVLLNVALRLRKGNTQLHMHVPLRMISFAVRNTDWIRAKLVRLPRYGREIVSADMHTIFVYHLKWRHPKTWLAGAAAALHMTRDHPLLKLDAAVTKRDRHILSPVYEELAKHSFTASQIKEVLAGMRMTLDALMASAVLDLAPVHRVNFISPETIEGG